MPILPEERQKNFPAGRIFYFAGFSIITAFILLSDVLYYHWITASVCCHFHRMHDIKNIENNEDYPMKKLIVNGAEQLYGGLALEREALYGDYLAHQIARLRRRTEGLRQSGSGEADGFAALADALEAKKGKWEHDNGT